MKKLFTIGFLFSFLLSIPAFAQVLIEENFDNGTADSSDITTVNTNWLRHSGAQGPAYSATGLVFTGLQGSGVGGALSFTNGSSGVNDGDVNRVASDSIAGVNTVYASFLVNLDSAKVTGDYFFHLGQKTLSTVFRGRVFARDTVAGGWVIGVSKSSEAAAYTTTVLSYNHTYLVVVKYLFSDASASDDQVQLFVYDSVPAQESDSPIVNLGPTGNGTASDPISIAAVVVREGTNTPTGKIDAIRLGTSFTDVVVSDGSLPVITIAEAVIDANSDYVPDKLNDTVHVKGIVISPNYQTSNRSYYIYDGTAGIATFQNGLLSPALNLGDEVDVRGVILHYNGLTEIDLLSDSSLVVLSDSNTVPEPKVLTISEFFADPEEYESELVAFTNLTKKSGTWPASGSSANLVFTNGTDTIVVRVDSDTDIDGQTEPTYPVDIIGVITQFKSGAPYTSGYQLQPRYFATDFLPAGTLPVELVSLSATSTGSSVRISWSTASEKNNRGFEVERKEANGSFRNVGFVSGNGTTTQQQVYSFVDANVTNGKYSYRLKQVDYDGTYKYSDAVEVSVNVLHKFALDQNFPNPFNPSTTIKFTLSVDSKVNMKVYNVLGQEITTLINSNYVAGPHEVKFNASNLNSGVYFYKLIVNGIDGSSFSSVKKMILAK